MIDRDVSEFNGTERSTPHDVGQLYATFRSFDLLVLDYGGVCTLSHEELLVGSESIAMGERRDCLVVITLAHDAGLQVAVLSNEIDRAWIDDSPVLTQVDHVLACADNGIFKPDRRAFQRASVVAGASPDRTLVVDDEIDNVRGAQAAGMTAILFDPSNPHSSWEAVEAALRGA